MAAESALNASPVREVYIDRRVVTVKPDRIDVHPARSIIFLPLLALALGIAIFPAIFFWGDGLSLGVRLALTLAAIVIIPVAGMGLVYSIAGAHIVIERHKQSAVLQQGFLGMGVGTQELVPFWKIDKILVQEITPQMYGGQQEDFVQYEISIVKVSGKRISVGMVTVPRVGEREGLERARQVAAAMADMAGSRVSISRRRQPKRAEVAS